MEWDCSSEDTEFVLSGDENRDRLCRVNRKESLKDRKKGVKRGKGKKERKTGGRKLFIAWPSAGAYTYHCGLTVRPFPTDEHILVTANHAF